MPLMSGHFIKDRMAAMAAALTAHGPAGAALLVGLFLTFLAAVNPVFLAPSGPAAAAPIPLAAATQGGDPLLVPPAADPSTLLPIAPEDALARNAALAIAEGPNPAAAAFRLTADEVTRMRSIDCLTSAIYYEAGLEPTDGQRAVAQVILNRMRHPAYPNSVCGVVFQGHQRVTGCQFTFTCDGSLRRSPVPALWDRARRVAEAALSGYVFAPVGLATHYHANYVFPYWAPTLAKVTTIGAHIFYRWDGGWGRPGAFRNRYAGAEPDIRWRGGFGQPERGVVVEGAPASGEAPAPGAAAEGQAGAAEAHSVDSFQRAVLRRYEPLQRDSANRIIQERMRMRTTTQSGRWALTGEASGDQTALGRREGAPDGLEGVRRRPGAAAAPPPAPAPAPAPGNTSEAR